MTAILTVFFQFALTAIVAFWSVWCFVESENMRDERRSNRQDFL